MQRQLIGTAILMGERFPAATALALAHCEILEQRSGIEISGRFRRGNQRVVIVAVADRFFEDRRAER